VVGAAAAKSPSLSAAAFTKANAASEVTVTCGSVTVTVITGAAEVVLDGRVTVISIPAGVTATVTDNGDGTFLVQNVAGAGDVTVTVGGTQTTVSPGGSRSYVVVYPFAGFFSPVDNLPTLNAAKAGSAIPVKFSLGGNQGLAILAVGYPKSQKIGCGSSAPLDTVEETVTAGSSSLSYAAGEGQYHYVCKTDKAWAGTCRHLIVKLIDATVHVANFNQIGQSQTRLTTTPGPAPGPFKANAAEMQHDRAPTGGLSSAAVVLAWASLELRADLELCKPKPSVFEMTQKLTQC
jgi:hypothetical protein